MSESAKKAVVWSFYDKNVIQKTVICKLCKKSYKDFGNTTNMISHMKSKHPIQYKYKGEPSSSQACSSTSEGKSSASSSIADSNATIGISKKRRFQQLQLARPNAFMSADSFHHLVEKSLKSKRRFMILMIMSIVSQLIRKMLWLKNGRSRLLLLSR